ncbi:hypothetical protein LJ737_15350 [Hymenobacter sp. 15J16-1T3B]|uniref:hypothetical protein n=1 Tax=Hymenobacter sp. 15J16-1T3B TaxID=2886941 RepID=UPI001D117367|nr:hypothetical protein [Hymenobacter sp. 15J16-1T3B]MCC3158625.1 hypothetical protein [Hymenobacter sp. 15J16-1T3B]
MGTNRAQQQEELRAFTALVRFLFTRQGGQIPVPAERLAQAECRLLDLPAGLAPPLGPFLRKLVRPALCAEDSLRSAVF